MPNWCEGNLKIRGKRENLIKFIKEGTSLLEGFFESIEVEPDVEITEYEELIIKNLDSKRKRDCLYIKDTTRHFIENITDIYMYDDSKEEQVICFENFKAAWSIETEQLRRISEKYNIDFKIYGFEGGQEFNQDIEITKGKIIKNETIEFKSYIWECINPNLGG